MMTACLSRPSSPFSVRANQAAQNLERYHLAGAPSCRSSLTFVAKKLLVKLQNLSLTHIQLWLKKFYPRCMYDRRRRAKHNLMQLQNVLAFVMRINVSVHESR